MKTTKAVVKPETIAKVLTFSFIASYLFVMVFPVYWMFTGAFKEDTEIYDPTAIFPWNPTLKYFLPPIFDPIYLRWLANSAIVAVSVSFITVMIAIPAAYSLSRSTGRLASITRRLLIFGYIFPPTFLVVGYAKLLVTFKLINTLIGLILAHISFTLPYVTYLILSYMFSIPRDLDEALLVDGYSRWHILFKLVVPLSFPVLITAIIWTFMWSWNEVLYALVILNEKTQLTMPIGLNTLQGGEISPWGQVFALSLIYTIPPLVLFYALRRYYITGVTKGAVKVA